MQKVNWRKKETTVEKLTFYFKCTEVTTDDNKAIGYDKFDKFHWNEKALLAYEGRVMNLQKEAAILEQKLYAAKHESFHISHKRSREAEKVKVAKNSFKTNRLLFH